jgi:Bacterial Ig-like domain (group 2)
LTRCACLLGLTCLLSACAAGDPVDPTPPGLAHVASLSLSTPRDTVYVGDTLTLKLEARDSAGNLLTGRSMNWLSSDTTRAKVSPVGIVTGVEGGKVTVTAATGDQVATVNVAVRRLVFAVNVVPDAICLRKGFSTALAITAFDSLGQPLPVGFRPITWGTSNGLVVSITPEPHDSALVLGASPGTASVFGSILGVADTTSFVVDPAPLGQPLVCDTGG